MHLTWLPKFHTSEERCLERYFCLPGDSATMSLNLEVRHFVYPLVQQLKAFGLSTDITPQPGKSSVCQGIDT